MLANITRDYKDIVITTFNHPLARDEVGYYLFIDDYHFEANYKKAYDDIKKLYPNDFILVIGSLEFANLIKQHILESKRK